MKNMRHIRYILAGSFLITMLFASKLWFGDSRLIPTVGVWPEFVQLNTLIQNALSVMLIAGLVLSIFQRTSLVGTLLALGAFVFLVLDDINRLQSYYYQYMAMLVALALLSKQAKNKQASVLYFILIGIYFHSGLTKLNANFIAYVFPNMLYAFHYFSLEEWQATSWQFMAYSIPLGEMILALLLLIPKTRKIGLYTALVLHLGILYSIGPWGLDWNPIVWVWNFSMMALNVGLYRVLPDSNLSYKNIVAIAAMILFILLPFFNRFGLWNNYLSFSLYSGTTPNRQLHVSQIDLASEIPLFYVENDTFIDLNVWALEDIHTAIYAEDWVFDEVAHTMCQQISCDTIIPFQVYKQSISYVAE